MSSHSLDKLFNPKAIAIVGAPQDPRRPGGQALKPLTTLSYAGAVYAVNPRYSEIEGRPCRESADALPSSCELGVIALAATARRVSWLMADHADVLEEVESSPLLAGPPGAMAVDAVIRMRAP